MQLTAKNLDKRLDDAGLLILARVMADGTPHTHRLRRTETVEYAPAVTYNTAEEVMSHVTDMMDNVVALIHKFPNRPAQRYTVKYGEVL